MNAPAYRHAQTGWWLVAWAVLWIALCAYMGTRLVVLGPTIAVILAIAGAAFARLSIRVDDDALAWSMTFGFPAGSMAISEIASAQIIPLGLWNGIGIHGYPGHWLWNVALGQGVKVEKADGNVVVLGSDEPQALLDAIERARAPA